MVRVEVSARTGTDGAPVAAHPDAPTPTPAPGPAVVGAPAFADVYTGHVAFVWRSLRRLGVREADCDDAAQEVFLVVHRKLAAFLGPSPIRTWLFAICLRVASDHRRRAAARRELVGERVPDQAMAAPQPEALARAQARALLDGILDRLDDDKRAVFVLYEIEQLCMNEVAATVGCPLQTAYSRLHAARKQVDEGVRRLHLRQDERDRMREAERRGDGS